MITNILYTTLNTLYIYIVQTVHTTLYTILTILISRTPFESFKIERASFNSGATLTNDGSGYTIIVIVSETKSTPFKASDTSYSPSSLNLGGRQTITPSFTNFPSDDLGGTKATPVLENFTTISSDG